jgi:SCY1-like protein 1
MDTQVALAFVNETAASTHGNVCIQSVFITPSGEWKLGGFELLSNPKESDAAVLYVCTGLTTSGLYLNSWVRLWAAFSPSRVHMRHLKSRKVDGRSSKSMQAPTRAKFKFSRRYFRHHPAVADAYALGLLLLAVFNPNQGPPATAQPPHNPPLASSRGAIPTSVFPSYKKLLNPNPRARMSTQAFLDVGMSQTGGNESGFYVNNPLVKVCQGLDNFNLANDAEKANFLR